MVPLKLSYRSFWVVFLRQVEDYWHQASPIRRLSQLSWVMLFLEEAPSPPCNFILTATSLSPTTATFRLWVFMISNSLLMSCKLHSCTDETLSKPTIKKRRVLHGSQAGHVWGFYAICYGAISRAACDEIQLWQVFRDASEKKAS